jgi:hypothetical protein
MLNEKSQNLEESMDRRNDQPDNPVHPVTAEDYYSQPQINQYEIEAAAYFASQAQHVQDELLARNVQPDRYQDVVEEVRQSDRARASCFRQLDLAPFDLLFWPHPLVIHHSAPGRSEALRRP